ncbi:helix-turn-helix domain-containing protein [uncultured Acetobacteroides sp.]|uniref:helix-turn-helix transcriptional regulator n=1 Tax=uncultured Acetobacteroides sp. TaxID=1760811 RepID=UPI0029F45D8A|nr:helix-turn-helix domain-containing protein [uncultured Acetobacteroides sp.]
MISLEELYSLLVILAPAITSFAALLILTLDTMRGGSGEWRLRSRVFLYFGSALVSWLSLLCYFHLPELFVRINWLSYLAFMLIQVYFYGFIFKVTRIDAAERFSWWHYLLPGLIALGLLMLQQVTPQAEQLRVVVGHGEYDGAERLFFRYSNSKLAVRLVFTVVYTLLAFRRLARYQRFAAEQPNGRPNLLRWVLGFLFFSVLLLVIPSLALIYSRSTVLGTVVMGFQTLVLVLQYCYLCYYVLAGHYVTIVEDEPPLLGTGVAEPDGAALPKKSLLTRERFEEYMQVERPFLNPSLKIADLVETLGVNRTYISSFINSEYGVNFSAYINQRRLQEYRQLLSDSANEDRSKIELSEMAGFSSYRSFLRVADSGE